MILLRLVFRTSQQFQYQRVKMGLSILPPNIGAGTQDLTVKLISVDEEDLVLEKIN
jgi:hypothetical protein